MKTKVEIAGYEIEIEEKDGLIMVKAEREDEIVEEFTIETEEFEGGEEGQGQGEEEVQGFGDFEGGAEEEGDFEGEDDDNDDDDNEVQLESFQSFVNKNVKK
jgi:hypothetical protein